MTDKARLAPPYFLCLSTRSEAIQRDQHPDDATLQRGEGNWQIACINFFVSKNITTLCAREFMRHQNVFRESEGRRLRQTIESKYQVPPS